MVNTVQVRGIDTRRVNALVGLYVVVVAATLVALALLAAAGSSQATADAWIHAAIVAFFAVLLPLRLLRANRGSRDAWRAVGIISAILVVANVVEAVVPGLFPVWMRIENIGIAVLMAVVVAQVVRVRR